MDPLNIIVHDNEIISLEKYKKYFKDIIVFDVGANRGLWSLVALVEGAKFIVAFDPCPIADLVRNLSQFAGKYRCINAFVTDKEHLSEDGFRITIDDFVRKDPQKPGFIKIDVEGDELEVLRGAEQTIKKFRPHLMIESYDYIAPERKEKIQLLMKSWNFREQQITITSDPGNSSRIYHNFYKGG